MAEDDDAAPVMRQLERSPRQSARALATIVGVSLVTNALLVGLFALWTVRCSLWVKEERTAVAWLAARSALFSAQAGPRLLIFLRLRRAASMPAREARERLARLLKSRAWGWTSRCGLVVYALLLLLPFLSWAEMASPWLGALLASHVLSLALHTAASFAVLCRVADPEGAGLAAEDLDQMAEPCAYSAGAAGTEHFEAECPICAVAFAEGAACRRLPCGHGFHDECASRWLVRRPTCPMCTLSVYCAAEDSGLRQRAPG